MDRDGPRWRRQAAGPIRRGATGSGGPRQAGGRLPSSKERCSRGRVTVQEPIELNRDLTPVAIPIRVMHELHSHALAAEPEECCGLVAGTPDDRFQRAVRISNVMTKKHLADPVAFPRDARHAYYMNEVEYLRAANEAEEKGQIITAVYHSHVDAGPYLSREDLAYAEHPLFPFPGAAQIVISLVGQRIAESAIFEFDEQAGLFSRDGGRPVELVDR